ncbi:MAG: AhpC/TSA family protein [Bacteroidales bacterium]|jgi:peroxiredoxin|nr:AhpC/TSA family protein [Bacteroidales bacterium]
MKHLIYITIILALYACSEHKGYIIKGIADGFDGQTVYLQQFNDSKAVIVDSAVVKKGKFELKNTVECPDYCLLYIGNNGPVEFFVENSHITITIDAEDIMASVVSGSHENDLFAGFSARINEFGKQSKQLNDEYMALQLSEVADTPEEASVLAQMNNLSQERTKFMSDFVEEHPSSVVSAFVIANVLSHYGDIEQFASVIDGFEENHPSQWVQTNRERLETARRTEIGRKFTDFSMDSPEGQPVKLSDYAGNGKYVLIDFWASWCRPCRNSNPLVVEAYRKYKDKGFEIVGVSLDRNHAEWTDAIHKDELEWRHMSDLKFWDSEAVKLYSVNSIPYAILLDKDGRIIEKGVHADALDELLPQYLK